MLTLISRQVSVELQASQAYMAASIWFRARNMDGMAAWMLDESDEERGHGKQILVSSVIDSTELRGVDASKLAYSSAPSYQSQLSPVALVGRWI